MALKIPDDLHVKFNCAICGDAKSYQLKVRLTEGHRIVKCVECQMESVYPLPSIRDLKDYYRTYCYIGDGEPAYTVNPKEHIKIINYLVSSVKNGIHPEFLDYGFGGGTFVKMIAEKGFKITAAEVNEYKCKRLTNYSKEKHLSIDTVNLSEMPCEKLGKDRYDVITLFQVLEHIPDPLQLLRSLFSTQKTGGILYLECPNNDAFYLKVKNMVRSYFKRENFYNSLNPPQHIHGFNRLSLSKILKMSGYKPIEIKDYAYGDGVHQVETRLFYPLVTEILPRKSSRNLYQFAKAIVRIADPVASRLFKAGGGLYALARKEK